MSLFLFLFCFSFFLPSFTIWILFPDMNILDLVVQIFYWFVS